LSKNILTQAINLHKAGRLDEAKIKYQELLLIDNNNFDAYHFLSWIAYDQKDYKLGLSLILKAIQINPKIPSAFNYLGLFHKEFRNYRDAKKSFISAIDLDQNNIDAHINLGSVLVSQFLFDDAIKEFNKVIVIQKDSFMAYNNIGFCLMSLNKYIEALDFFNKAISIKSDFAPAYFNRAKLNLITKKKSDQVILLDLNYAIFLDENQSEYYFERGVFFMNKKDFSSAARDFQQTYYLNSQYLSILGYILYNESLIFNLDKRYLLIEKIEQNIKNNLIPTAPFIFLYMKDNLDLQFNLVKNISNLEKISIDLFKKINFSKKLDKQRIKVAYFSSDFGEHPIGRQIIELFELHDRNNFEIYLFSLKQRPNCLLRQRIIKASDHFIEVHDKTFLEIIDLVRSLNIDIAIDLNGYTAGRKSEIFCSRVAPIQVNYLGYPGTMGADFMDYIIADKIVIPKEYMEKYSEKIVYLPNSFMVNDRLKKISEQKLTRSDFGLKDDQFVFCCFNAVYKITEEIFKTWMNILNKVSNSILWLKEPNEIAKNNIIKEFEKNGIYPERVSFLKFSEHSAYLATHRLADLYLDTFPYNAHSMASESLWAGLPLITLIGKSFHTRVAASILNAINLPELITNSLEEYEKLAIELALNPQKLKNIKNKLNSNIKTAPLFDTPPYTKNLESAYKKMYERYQSDQKPDHIYI
jgi:predicted O-linked N-acetylglucosamine transferase (SPINDLY family)